MSMKTKAAILIPSALVLLFTIVGGIDAVRAANTTDGAYRQLQVYSEVLSRVRSEYVEDPNCRLSLTVRYTDCWSPSTPIPVFLPATNTRLIKRTIPRRRPTLALPFPNALDTPR